MSKTVGYNTRTVVERSTLIAQGYMEERVQKTVLYVFPEAVTREEARRLLKKTGQLVRDNALVCVTRMFEPTEPYVYVDPTKL